MKIQENGFGYFLIFKVLGKYSYSNYVFYCYDFFKVCKVC